MTVHLADARMNIPHTHERRHFYGELETQDFYGGHAAAGGGGSGRKSSSSSSGNSGGTSVYSSTSGSSSSGFQEVSGVTTKVVARKDARSSNNKDYGTLVLKFYKNGSPYQFESGNYAVSFDIVACGYHHGNKTPWEFTVR